MRADNSAHLRAAARSKHDATRRRALAALDKLETDSKHVTVTALAEAAGVARSWIYTQTDVMDRINAAPEHPARSQPTRTTDESWRRRLELAHQRIEELTEENKQLRTQLALAHGQRRAEQITAIRTPSATQTT